MKSLQAIIFDFDGVIANSEPLHLRAFQQALGDEGLFLSADEYYTRYLGFDDVGTFQALSRDRRLAWSARQVGQLVTRKGVTLQEMVHSGDVLFPGAGDFIRLAAAKVPIAIASGALGAEIRRTLEREQLAGLFAAVVAAEDTPVGKPAPDPYLRALVLLSEATGARVAASECVAVEDSPWGLQSARAAGMHTVAVAQTYEAATLDADIVISSLGLLDLKALEQLCR